MPNSLSQNMMQALDRAKRAGKLYRWTGGYWSDKAPPPNAGFPPAGTWSVAWGTINALINRGLLEVVDCFDYGTRDPRVVAPVDGERP